MSLGSSLRYKKKNLISYRFREHMGFRTRLVTEITYNISSDWITVSSFFGFNRT